MKKLSVLLAAVLFSLGLQIANAQTTVSPNNSGLMWLTKADFLQKVHNYERDSTEFKYLGTKPAIVVFLPTNDWCPPCEKIKVALKELQPKYSNRLLFYFVDSDKEKEISGMYDVKNVPLLLFIPLNGKVQGYAGFNSKEILEGIIEDIFFANSQLLAQQMFDEGLKAFNKEDYAKAREWYAKAAEKDNTDAIHYLGWMYQNGQGVTQDYAKAHEYYAKAAKAGYAASMNNLGYLYENGLSVTRDYAKAREWYVKAAEKGNATAMNNLGYIYKEGVGVTQDYAKARQWYAKAADAGNEVAKEKIKEIDKLLAQNGNSFSQTTPLQAGKPQAQTCAKKGGVMINNVCWATRNVDKPGTFAASSESAGMFYQWNRKVAYPATTGSVRNWDSSNPTGTEWEKANDPSPTGWRVPTVQELKSLLNEDKVSRTWTTKNGVNGCKFTDKTSGASIFFPAADFRNLEGVPQFLAGVFGTYWSSEKSGNYYVRDMFISSDFVNFNDDYPTFGRSIRSVAE